MSSSSFSVEHIKVALDFYKKDLKGKSLTDMTVSQEEDIWVIRAVHRGLSQIITSFSITQHPGCCGVVIFYHVTISYNLRGLGLGQLFLKIREYAALKAGYTMAIATATKINKVQVHILEKAGWKCGESFVNSYTQNMVLFFTKNLRKGLK